MAFVSAADGAEIFFKDWGEGPPIVLSHGWPLTADSWDAPMGELVANGKRCVAHDRRGHGRSSQTWAGNDMDTTADDLATLIDMLDLRDAVLVGFAAGGGEIARYVGRHGTGRVAGIVLVAPVTPYLRRTVDNPGGVAASTFDALRAGSLADRSQLYQDLADGPFFGLNRPGAEVSKGVRDDFWRQAMQAGHHNAFQAIAAFADTDFRADLTAFDVPTLVIHGADDQIVPVAGGRATAASVPGSTLIVYEGAPHGLTHTHAGRLTADLLDFVADR